MSPWIGDSLPTPGSNVASMALRFVVPTALFGATVPTCPPCPLGPGTVTSAKPRVFPVSFAMRAQTQTGAAVAAQRPKPIRPPPRGLAKVTSPLITVDRLIVLLLADVDPKQIKATPHQHSLAGHKIRQDLGR
jgi:hypothetical protein